MALLDVVIDVSDANGTIDWATVVAGGTGLAIVKASEGATFRARTWASNSVAARAAGIQVIPYHFVTHADATAQAAHFGAVAGLTPGMPYALDWEKRVLRDGTDLTASAAQVEAMGQALVAKFGRNPLGYWGIPGSAPGTPTPVMSTWERWVPRYRIGKIGSFDDMPASSRSPEVPFLFWQYTDGGVIDGIDVDVDRSVAQFDTIDNLLAWCGPRAAAGPMAIGGTGDRPA